MLLKVEQTSSVKSIGWAKPQGRCYFSLKRAIDGTKFSWGRAFCLHGFPKGTLFSITFSTSS